MDAARLTDCSLLIATQFVTDPTAPLDTSCLESILPMNFQGTAEDNLLFWGTPDAWSGWAPQALQPQQAARIKARRAEIAARTRGPARPPLVLPALPGLPPIP